MSGNMSVSMLILRIFSFTLLAASVALLVTNNFTDSQGDNTSFKDLVTYRYVVAASVIGLSYTLLQFPFAIYYACMQKRMIRAELDFYGDKIICYILSSALGAGLSVSVELKSFISDFFDILVVSGLPLSEDDEHKNVKFLNRGIVATSLLGGAFVFMAAVSVLSSMERKIPEKGFFRK